MKKVLLGLSGGVDSAVAAYLLKEQGYDVTCGFMRNWDALANNDILGNPTNQDPVCPQEEDYQDAQSVADALGLPLVRMDFVQEYWNEVFSVFLDEYKKGRTPNPDILCNKYIKFDHFYTYAKSQGFDTLATGHYVKRVELEEGSILAKADDRNKDQSYFLCQISKEAIAHSLFPLGEVDKPTVRRIAQELNLTIANKKDSTGICFIGERNFREFLKNYLPSQPGEIWDVDTKTIKGQHEGVLYYTIGQRKGLQIGGEGGPWFVVGKDVEKNRLLVSNEKKKNWLTSTSCTVSGVVWQKELPSEPFSCTAKFRYRQKDHEVILTKEKDRVRCTYPQGVDGVTPGQEAVFYEGDWMLGGGVIEEIYDSQGRNLMDEIQHLIP